MTAELRCPRFADAATQAYWQALWNARLRVFRAVFPWLDGQILALAGLPQDVRIEFGAPAELSRRIVAAYDAFEHGYLADDPRLRELHDRVNREWREITNLPPLGTPGDWWTAATAAGGNPPREFSQDDFDRFSGLIAGWAGRLRTAAGPADAPPADAAGFLGGTPLADALCVPASRRNAFFRQLERKRPALGDLNWQEVRDPRPNSPRFLYCADAPEVRAIAARYRVG